MPDRILADTNILIYFISDEKKKKLRAKEIIFSSEDIFISAQVISEFINIHCNLDIVRFTIPA